MLSFFPPLPGIPDPPHDHVWRSRASPRVQNKRCVQPLLGGGTFIFVHPVPCPLSPVPCPLSPLASYTASLKLTCDVLYLRWLDGLSVVVVVVVVRIFLKGYQRGRVLSGNLLGTINRLLLYNDRVTRLVALLQGCITVQTSESIIECMFGWGEGAG